MRALFLLLALTATPALAVDVPAPGPKDYRVTFVDYKANDVTKLMVHYGYLTNIVFSPGEAVLEKGIYLGDAEAWTIGTLNNHLFIKAKAEGGRTNMTVLTNYRAYSFEVSAHWSKKGQYSNDMMYQVNFRYPEDEARAAQIAAAADGMRHDEASLRDRMQDSPDAKNWNYWVQGSASVTPDAAYDDGQFTYFQFKGNREMPAIFMVNDDGSESLINRNVNGDTITVQSLGKKFVFRKGKQVACVFNESYDPVGYDAGTGTTREDVERDIRGRTE